ncbi:MAG: hypothetical protein DMF54_06140 [Acidobacteria bacterium]|nr:MAG: hypothetical protein DMF55_06475 [Acidobacteriota bacterium]PYQ66924.1 MAG: hypothetical protein DMF54_06140 [Acidobacteriota bacterium]
MKSTSRATIFATALLLGALPVAAATASHVFDLSSMLSGTYEGTTPGNEMRLTIRSITTDPSHLYDLFLTAIGKYQGQNVRQQGLIRLEQQGDGVYFGYIPHFDPTVSSMSPEAARFTDDEANAACGSVLKAKGDGFAGETAGSSCMRAIRGALGKWTLEIEPGTIRIRNVKSGETLRFKRASK